MQKVQIVNLALVEDKQRMIDDYEFLGFTTRVEGDDLHIFWGKPPKKKKENEKKTDKTEHKPGQEKTARRLGR